ncbi:hypothetical protein WN48_05227 [Eufriesea mexicana]|uniref:Uncharacterized protein n=1 Tax=Eufriesea mexicana TaxID=516756 RepID=A0A310SHG2_9HYME|nr:hypothetical protein WN48_05227 [Eufriesea mexicana]
MVGGWAFGGFCATLDRRWAHAVTSHVSALIEQTRWLDWSEDDRRKSQGLRKQGDSGTYLVAGFVPSSRIVVGTARGALDEASLTDYKPCPANIVVERTVLSDGRSTGSDRNREQDFPLASDAMRQTASSALPVFAMIADEHGAAGDKTLLNSQISSE